MPVGLSPKSADEVNLNVGMLLRTFTDTRAKVKVQADWLAATDLKLDPYLMTAEDETAIKSAVVSLNDALQAIDMTFISRLIGLPT